MECAAQGCGFNAVAACQGPCGQRYCGQEFAYGDKAGNAVRTAQFKLVGDLHENEHPKWQVNEAFEHWFWSVGAPERLWCFQDRAVGIKERVMDEARAIANKQEHWAKFGRPAQLSNAVKRFIASGSTPASPIPGTTDLGWAIGEETGSDYYGSSVVQATYYPALVGRLPLLV